MSSMLVKRASKFSNSRKPFRQSYRQFASGTGKVLVVAEFNGKTLVPSTLNTISAASKLGEVSVLVSGKDVNDLVSSVSKIDGVKQVLVADSPSLEKPLAETASQAILDAQKAHSFTHILASATSFGKNVFPRVSALLDVAQISEITEVIDADTFVRPIYAGNALTTIRSKDPVKVITVRGTSFPKAVEGKNVAPTLPLSTNPSSTNSKWEGQEVKKSERPELASASRVVAGGRALKSGDNFKILYELADKINAAVGASRAAVDAGYVSNDLQIGQTGKIVAPELYVAVGISGAIQHLAGMKDSKVIVAINKNADAPIFQVADYGLVADLFTAVPELTKAV